MAHTMWSGNITLSNTNAPGTRPPNLTAAKQQALAQMRQDLTQAVYPCLTAGAGLTLFVGGGLALGPIVGGTMVGVATPLCVSLVRELIELSKVVNDPSERNFRQIARITRTARSSLGLPACSSLTGKDRGLCGRLEVGAARYVGKVQHASDIATALEKTVSRESGAIDAGNHAAIKLQDRATRRRSKQLEVAVRARVKSGAKLASLLRTAQATGQMTEAQSAQGIGIVVADLAQQGVPEGVAQSLLGSALTPQAVDLLSLLAQP